MALTFKDYPFLAELGLTEENFGTYDGTWHAKGEASVMMNPSTGKPVAKVLETTPEEYDECLDKLVEAQKEWALVPAPKRGEILRQMANAFREKLEPLGKLVSLEMGKGYHEGIGEVVETIDILDYAVGLTRTYGGAAVQSERPEHFMYESWNPLGVCGIISAFNFPNAVLGWNAAIALAVGDACVWKAASSVRLVAVATSKIIADVLEKNKMPAAFGLITIKGRDSDKMLKDPRLPLISFTGSTKIGRHVNEITASRFAKSILELGGNNAVIVLEDGDVELAIRSCLFAATGTTGQRCTSLRRLIVHEKVYDEVKEKLVKAYKSLSIGDALDAKNLVGPLHNPAAVEEYKLTIKEGLEQGGKLLIGGKVLDKPGYFVEPAIFESNMDMPLCHNERFVPVLHLMKCTNFDEAIKMNNMVVQGLTSSVFTKDVARLFKWLGPNGSDCGIINVNIPTSGAEIGGAFGGNKETGGGREAGSDSWKQYCRRGTVTINYGDALPLAQGIDFGS